MTEDRCVKIEDGWRTTEERGRKTGDRRVDPPEGEVRSGKRVYRSSIIPINLSLVKGLMIKPATLLRDFARPSSLGDMEEEQI